MLRVVNHRWSQAFAGGGCIATDATYCACQHLTDFASGGAPKISVCSAKDLLSLSPGDIVNKLRTFLYMICGLFGSMHLGSFVGYVIDRRSKRKTMEELLEPGVVGFLPMGSELAWTWLLEQASLFDSSCCSIPAFDSCS